MQRPGDPTFLSNVNACYARRCWEEIRFRDVAYAEDQAFGVDLLAAGWVKVYQPAAAVLHAHDYPLRRVHAPLLRRVSRPAPDDRSRRAVRMPGTLRYVAHSVAADRRWIGEHGAPPAGRPGWVVRSAAHHGGRRVFSALGSRADALPAVGAAAALARGRAGDGLAVPRTASPSRPIGAGVLESAAPVPRVLDEATRTRPPHG